jgi:hypothetical protein
MKFALVALWLGLGAAAHAADGRLPPEVEAFVRDRELCDHFRAEPFEGDSPAQIERRAFVFESLEIYCPGTDRRLAALKRRYRDNPEIMRRLGQYEERAEGAGPR